MWILPHGYYTHSRYRSDEQQAEHQLSRSCPPKEAFEACLALNSSFLHHCSASGERQRWNPGQTLGWSLFRCFAFVAKSDSDHSLPKVPNTRQDQENLPDHPVLLMTVVRCLVLVSPPTPLRLHLNLLARGSSTTIRGPGIPG